MHLNGYLPIHVNIVRSPALAIMPVDSCQHVQSRQVFSIETTRRLLSISFASLPVAAARSKSLASKPLTIFLKRREEVIFHSGSNSATMDDIGITSSTLTAQLPELVSTSFSSRTDANSDGNNDPMDVCGVKGDDSENVSMEAIDEDLDDVVDFDLLRDLLVQIKKAGCKIAGKDVMLLIGATGAGKVGY